MTRPSLPDPPLAPEDEHRPDPQVAAAVLREARTAGLTCPHCAAIVPLPEGSRIVQCEACQGRAFVTGDRDLPRWQVARRIEPEAVRKAVTRFWQGPDRVWGLARRARIVDLYLVYLPFWRMRGYVAGWLFGTVSAGQNRSRPVEVAVYEEMHWNDAATDVAELGVHQVSASHDDLQPFDSQAVHAEALVFEPTESPDDAREEARRHFIWRCRQERKFSEITGEFIEVIRDQLSIVYYPLWVVRYSFGRRHYPVVVDGVKGTVLYGRAPGNLAYRAMRLTGGMGLGTFILVNGTALALRILAEAPDEDCLVILLAPLAVGIGLCAAGYRAFRHGEQIEIRHKEAHKARLPGQDDPDEEDTVMTQGLRILNDLTDLDLSF